MSASAGLLRSFERTAVAGIGVNLRQSRLCVLLLTNANSFHPPALNTEVAVNRGRREPSEIVRRSSGLLGEDLLALKSYN